MKEWITAVLVFIAAALVFLWVVQSIWRKHLSRCTPLRGTLYTAYVDEAGKLLFIELAEQEPSLFRQSISVPVLNVIHLVSLGFLAGAACVFRLGQICLSAEMVDLPAWALIWVSLVSLLWFLVYLVEYAVFRQSQFREYLKELCGKDGRDEVAVCISLHGLVVQHRMILLILAAVGMPAPWQVSSAVVVILATVIAGFYWLTKSKGWLRQFIIPSELERPFLSLPEQIREGVWVTPAGFLLVIAAATLVYFGDVSSLAVAVISIIGAGLVIVSERLSRIHTHSQTLEELRDRLKTYLLAGEYQSHRAQAVPRS